MGPLRCLMTTEKYLVEMCVDIVVWGGLDLHFEEGEGWRW